MLRQTCTMGLFANIKCILYILLQFPSPVRPSDPVRVLNHPQLYALQCNATSATKPTETTTLSRERFYYHYHCTYHPKPAEEQGRKLYDTHVNRGRDRLLTSRNTVSGRHRFAYNLKHGYRDP